MIPARSALFYVLILASCLVLRAGRAELTRLPQEAPPPTPAGEESGGQEPAQPQDGEEPEDAEEPAQPQEDEEPEDAEEPALPEAPLGVRPVGVLHPELPRVQEVFTGRGRWLRGGHWTYPWGGWWVNTTVPYKHALYPPPVALEPRVGLQYNYPYAWQAGIQMPIDGDPHMLPDFPPYVGFVGRLKQLVAEMEAEAEEAAGDTSEVEVRRGVPPGVPEAIALQRAGQFRQAGRILARGFRKTSDPVYPFLLTEIFFALEKFDLAEMNLRHALKTGGAIASIPEGLRDGLADRFPSRERFEEHLASLAKTRPKSLLYAYMLLHSEKPQEGVGLLANLLQSNPDDATLAALYRGYLDRAF